MCLTASAWDCFGHVENLAHRCTAYDKSQRVDFSRKFDFPMAEQYDHGSSKAGPLMSLFRIFVAGPGVCLNLVLSLKPRPFRIC